MPSKKFKNSTFIPALNALGAWIQWLKPGLLSFRLSQLKSAIEPLAIEFQKTHQELIDEHCLFDLSEQPKGANGGGTPADDKVRKRRTRQNELGQTVYDMGVKEKDFDAKYKELMDGETEITYTRLITEDDIERGEKERREIKAGKDGQITELPPVDFSALLPFMEVENEAKEPEPATK